MSTEWLAAALEGGALGDGKLVVVESDEDVLLYETGHIPGAVKIDWHTDLNDEVTRDYVDGEAFAALAAAKGISRDTTMVIYGDKYNWWAAWALWVLTIYGHKDVRLLNGGRKKWIAEGRELTKEVPQYAKTSYAKPDSFDYSSRALLPKVLETLSGKSAHLVDVRSPQEFSGEILAPPGLPETCQRGGHIPGARSIPWGKACNEDGTFKSADDLAAVYKAEGIDGSKPVIAYCRIGERSSHSWFALKYLLGYDNV